MLVIRWSATMRSVSEAFHRDRTYVVAPGVSTTPAVETSYPWSGTVAIEVGSSTDAAWTLSLRIPAWARAAIVDGEPVAPGEYATLTRRWQAGDRVVLEIDVSPRLTAPNPRIDAVRECVALERGPIVYCVEEHRPSGRRGSGRRRSRPCGRPRRQRPGRAAGRPARRVARGRPPRHGRLAADRVSRPPRAAGDVGSSDAAARRSLFRVGEPGRGRDAGLDPRGGARSEEAAMATLSLEQLTKVFGNGVEAVRQLDLFVDDGEFVVLVGPSGCGKTTALRMVAGLEDGDLGDDPPRRQGRQRPSRQGSGRGDGLPELRPLSAHERAPEHRVLPQGARRGEAGARAEGARGGRRSSGSRRWCSGSPASSRAASASASPWGGRSCASRPCSSWTSRSRTSTPTCASRCAARCCGSSGGSASRRSTSPTTRRRR